MIVSQNLPRGNRSGDRDRIPHLFRKAAALHALVLVVGQNELQTGLNPRGKVSLADLKPNAIDIDKGSPPADRRNPRAARVLARALLHPFNRMEEPMQSVLCMGGVHFGSSFTNAVLRSRQGLALAATHLLSAGYDHATRKIHLRMRRELRPWWSSNHHIPRHAQIGRLLADELSTPMLSHGKMRAAVADGDAPG